MGGLGWRRVVPRRERDPVIEVYLQQYRKYYFFQERLNTFKNWPFLDGCGCTPENMAAAGFIHTPSENCPDVAQCFFCYKELEGWEPEDEPLVEHKNHSPKCAFIALKKEFEHLTAEEFLKLDKERVKNITKKQVSEMIESFEQKAKVTRSTIEDLVT
ncbi:baculoviral IAP repeat-containing protein 5 [Amblyraja radiata]|uniref:baculoviral IAP repeat-containing protein 5 n=1 Tax=Amblyraja radiata TaxID=386614 RepID=UPI001401F62E|nr:baculoviral IAP repeat-containing protein 5 [Amblyraja radiata]